MHPVLQCDGLSDSETVYRGACSNCNIFQIFLNATYYIPVAQREVIPEAASASSEARPPQLQKGHEAAQEGPP